MENREQNLENMNVQAVFNQSNLTARLNSLSSPERSGTPEEPIHSLGVATASTAAISSVTSSLSLNQTQMSGQESNSGNSFTITYNPDPINVVWIGSDGRRYYNVPGTTEFRPVDTTSLTATAIVDTYATSMSMNIPTKEKKKIKFLPKLTLKRDE